MALLQSNGLVGLACFFTFMTIAEGGGRKAVARKFQDIYLPALKANFMIWPAVQILNFRVIPLQFQIVSYGNVATSSLLTCNFSLLSPVLGLLGQCICLYQTPPRKR